MRKSFLGLNTTERFRKLIKDIRFVERLKGFQKMVSTAIIISVGAFLFLLGGWILLKQVAGWFDFYQPNSIKIGTVSIDTKESTSHSELFRARFNHHFRPYDTVPFEKGFIEVQALDLPRIFQSSESNTQLNNVSIEVSGVDVGVLYQLINRIAQPAQWIIEGDFQTMPDRVLLSLRMRRGERVIRTWYLEQYGEIAKEKATLVERLIDDAIFQLAFDFSNKNETNEDIAKWRSVLPEFNVNFPNRQAFSAYFEGRSGLARYFSTGDWRELERAIDNLRKLRALMPEYTEGLQLLALALAERRNESEAIHVYDQLLSLLSQAIATSSTDNKAAILEKHSATLQKATALLKLYEWKSTHQANAVLEALYNELDKHITQHCASTNTSTPDKTCIKIYELQSQTAIQLAYSYGIYLAYLKEKMVAEIFGNSNAPSDLKIEDKKELNILRSGLEDDGKAAKTIVKSVMRKSAQKHEDWIELADQKRKLFDSNWQVVALEQGNRRSQELKSRLNFVKGYTHYRIAELESSKPNAPLIVKDFDYRTRLTQAAKHLTKAEAAHPNHYQALQLLGLVYSEPRRSDTDLHIAEQYFERAIMAKPTDYFGYALRAELLLQKISDFGLQPSSIELVEKGLSDVRHAIALRPSSNTANILLCKYLLLKLETESSREKRDELWKILDSAIEKAGKYTPKLFKHVSIELDWVEIVTSLARLKEFTAALDQNKKGELDSDLKQTLKIQQANLLEKIEDLKTEVGRLNNRWVAHQHLFQVNGLKERAIKVSNKLVSITPETWRDFDVDVFKSLGKTVNLEHEVEKVIPKSLAQQGS